MPSIFTREPASTTVPAHGEIPPGEASRATAPGSMNTRLLLLAPVRSLSKLHTPSVAMSPPRPWTA